MLPTAYFDVISLYSVMETDLSCLSPVTSQGRFPTGKSTPGGPIRRAGRGKGRGTTALC